MVFFVGGNKLAIAEHTCNLFKPIPISTIAFCATAVRKSLALALLRSNHRLVPRSSVRSRTGPPASKPKRPHLFQPTHGQWHTHATYGPSRSSMLRRKMSSTHCGSVSGIAAGKLRAVGRSRSIDLIIHYHRSMTDAALAEVDDDDEEAIALTAEEIDDFELA